MDLIRGNPIRVLDGESLVLLITDDPDENDYVYDSAVTIKVREVEAPEPGTADAQEAREALESFVMGWEMVCEVHGKDERGRFVADVYRDEE